ncbi:MAG: MFS transporter [Candidatus Helarchaeota archaeon]
MVVSESSFNKKHFFYLLIFIMTFAISFMLAEIIAATIYLFGIPFIITLICSGIIVDRGYRLYPMFLLLGEGVLLIVLGLIFNSPQQMAVYLLLIILGLLSGITTCALMANFADNTDERFGKIERSTIAGFIFAITWVIIAITISAYITSLSSSIGQLIFSVILIIFGVVKFTGGICAVIIKFTAGESPEIVKYEFTGGISGFFKDSFGFLLTDRKYFTYWIGFMLIWIAQGILSQLISPYTGLNFLQIYTLGFATGGLILVAGGYMIDKIGRKNMIIYGMLLTTASFIVCIFDMGAVLVSGIAILVSIIFIVLADLAPPDFRGRYSGIFIGLIILGFLIGQIIGIGGSNPIYSISYYIAGAFLSAIALIIIIIFGKDSKQND